MNNRRAVDIALLLLRVVFGGAMLHAHGWGKMLTLFSGDPIQFADPFGIGPAASLGLAVFAEVLCAALLIIGLFSRYATIPLIITMVVAVFYIHIADPFPKMEKGLLYLTAYVTLLLTGPGWYSLDAQLRNRG